jgi:hypothetical protein
MAPRASNLTGVEIYSEQSFRELTTRAPSFNQADFSLHGHANGPQVGVFYDTFSLTSSKGVTPRTSLNFEEEMLKIGKRRKEDAMHMFAWSSAASSPINYGAATSTDFGLVNDISEAAIKVETASSIGALTFQPFNNICLLLINLVSMETEDVILGLKNLA